MSWKATEVYTADADAELAERLYESGLIFLVNAAVLHHHGIALGVNVDAGGQVTGLCLLETEDPDGIWFDEETVVAGRRKMREAGLR